MHHTDHKKLLPYESNRRKICLLNLHKVIGRISNSKCIKTLRPSASPPNLGFAPLFAAIHLLPNVTARPHHALKIGTVRSSNTPPSHRGRKEKKDKYTGFKWSIFLIQQVNCPDQGGKWETWTRPSCNCLLQMPIQVSRMLANYQGGP